MTETLKASPFSYECCCTNAPSLVPGYPPVPSITIIFLACQFAYTIEKCLLKKNVFYLHVNKTINIFGL